MASYSVDIVARALGGAQVDQLAKQFGAVDTAARKAQGGVDAAANNIRGFGNVAKTAEAGVTGLVGGLGRLAAAFGLTVGAVTLFKTSLDAAFSREAAETRLRALSNSTRDYELALGAAEIASKRFGVTQTEASNAIGDIYGRLKGLGLSLGEVNQIYTGFNVIAREARVSTEDAAGAFLQLSQAMGSGKLQGDELKLILERMPQLAQAIADGMGVSAGSIKQLASDGKIGLSEIQAALAKAAVRADELGSTFTGQQATMAQVRQRWEELQVQIGRTFAPLYLAAVEAMSKAVFLMGEYMKGAAAWATKNADAIGRIVSVGLEIGKIVGSVWLVIAAYQAWQKAVAAVATVKAFLLAMTGAGLKLVAIGAAASAAAYLVLSKGISDTAKEIKRMQGESEKAYQERKKQVEAELAGQIKVKDALADQGEQAKLLKKEVDALKTSYDHAAQSMDRIAERQQLIASVASARLGAEKAMNDLLGQRLEREYAAAQTAEERFDIAVAIFNQQVKAAELEHKQQVLNNKAAVDAAVLQERKVALKYQEIAAERDLAAARGQDVSAYDQALNNQGEAVQLAKEQLGAAQEIQRYSDQTAQALLQGKIEAAGMALETKLASDGIGIAVERARVLADEYARAASNAIAMAQAAKGNIGGAEASISSGFISGGGQTIKLASGGYVTGPTRAIVGEGGEPEYVIPASKMGQAMERYAGGARGASVVPQVNVAYNGTTVSMGGQDYISRKDIPGLISQAVGQTVQTLGGSPRMRRAAGIG